jgi:hypothetical protein
MRGEERAQKLRGARLVYAQDNNWGRVVGQRSRSGSQRCCSSFLVLQVYDHADGVGHLLAYLVGFIAQHYDDVADPGLAKLSDLVFDQRSAAPRQERLRPAHADRFTGCEEDGRAGRC